MNENNNGDEPGMQLQLATTLQRVLESLERRDRSNGNPLTLRDRLKSYPVYDGSTPTAFIEWSRRLTQNILEPYWNDEKKISTLMAKLTDDARSVAQSVLESMGVEFAQHNTAGDNEGTLVFTTPVKAKRLTVREGAVFTPNYDTFVQRMTRILVGASAATACKRLLDTCVMSEGNLRTHTSRWSSLFRDFVSAGGEMLESQKLDLYLSSIHTGILDKIEPIPITFTLAVTAAQRVYDDMQKKADLQERRGGGARRVAHQVVAALAAHADGTRPLRSGEQLLAAVAPGSMLPDTMGVRRENEREASHSDREGRDRLDPNRSLSNFLSGMVRKPQQGESGDSEEEGDRDRRQSKRQRTTRTPSAEGKVLYAIQTATNELHAASRRSAKDEARRAVVEQERGADLLAQLDRSRAEADRWRGTHTQGVETTPMADQRPFSPAKQREADLVAQLEQARAEVGRLTSGQTHRPQGGPRTDPRNGSMCYACQGSGHRWKECNGKCLHCKKEGFPSDHAITRCKKWQAYACPNCGLKGDHFKNACPRNQRGSSNRYGARR
jgi:hypothetical protein